MNRIALAILATAALSGCSVAAGAHVQVPAYARGGYEVREVRNIPPGHLPPPGSCRIWYPGTPPGQQPPPDRCDVLERSVQSGAWLLYRPDEARRVYRVN
jgi:hypothetical protein